MPSAMPVRGARPDASLARLLDAQGIDPRGAVAKLVAFEAMVRRWNARSRLVSRRDAERLRKRHVEDSLSLLPWWSGALADVGSGAGFPGVPLAIARPASPVVLVERSERKSRFLRQVVIDLELPNIDVVALDVAQYRPAALFDTVAARAVAPPEATWGLVRPLLVPGGAVLLQSRERLDAVRFPAGEIGQVERAGIGWVTVVRHQGP